VDQTLAELIIPTLDGLMMVLTVKPWPFLPPSPSSRRPEVYADMHVGTQRCPHAFSSLFYPQSAICPLILYPLVVIHRSLCQLFEARRWPPRAKMCDGLPRKQKQGGEALLECCLSQVACNVHWLMNLRSGLVHRQRSDRSREPHVMRRAARRGEGACQDT
jgi:hypothetical protein